MKILTDFSFDEIEGLVKNWGLAGFRAKQIFKWLNAGFEFEDMSELPKDLRAKLATEFIAQPIKIEQVFTSKDKTQKFLFKTHDSQFIEGVLMQYSYGATLCISTQIGCRINCAFCASSLNGLLRNLSAGEILGQVIAVNRFLNGNDRERKITNLVLMGSGEPLDNYDNTIKFLNLAIDERGLNFSSRNISVSTSGITPKILELAELNFGINLCLSLHATTDEVRQELIPIAKTYKLEQLIAAMRHYFNKTGRRVIFEYALIKNKNISPADAERLHALTKGMSAHINLIMLNPVKERNLHPCTKQEAQAFLTTLTKLGTSATLRRSMGSDIEGACGQLRNLYVGQKDPVSSAKKD